MPSKLTLRYADTTSEEAMRADARAIFGLSASLFSEAGIPERLAPVDPVKCLQFVYETIRDGLVLLVFDGEDLVGGLGCVEFDIWYSRKTMLSERFFYLQPGYREGEALRLILTEAKAIADQLGIFLQLTIANAHKERPPRNGLERIGAVLSYAPRGTAYQIAPQKGPSQ